MGINGVRLVCFDLGGVVVRIQRSFTGACRALGLPVFDGVEDRYRAQGPLLARLANGEIDLHYLAPALSKGLGGLYTPEQIHKIHHAWIIEEYEGVAQTVDRVLKTGAACAVLSNTDASHWDRLCSWPTLRRIPHLFASHLIGAAKPSVEAYRAVEADLGYAGAEILFFDDSAANVRAARSLGWRAEQIEPDVAAPAQQIERALQAHGVLASA